MYHVELLITNHSNCLILNSQQQTQQYFFVTPKSHRQYPSHSTKQHARTKKKKKKKKNVNIVPILNTAQFTRPGRKANNYIKKKHAYIYIYIFKQRRSYQSVPVIICKDRPIKITSRIILYTLQPMLFASHIVTSWYYMQLALVLVILYHTMLFYYSFVVSSVQFLCRTSLPYCNSL